jgi:HlyD family secretion protein
MFKEKMASWWREYKSKKRYWVITAIVLLIIIIIAGKSHKSEDATIATIEKKDLVEAVVLSGRTQSASAVDLGFAESGRVTQVLVKEGDRVGKGQLLASVDTSDLILSDIAKITREQGALVANAYRNLLSIGLQAVPDNLSVSAEAPTISGVYNGPEGDYRIRIYASGASSGASFEVSGLENGFIQEITPNTTVPLGSRGLYIQFGNSNGYAGTSWTVSIPNKRASTYSTYLNTYESAKATRDRVLSDAQASNETLLSRINKRKIYAPFSGVVAKVGIKAGEAAGSVGSATAAPTITLISENDYEVILKVPEISVAKLAVGQAVDIRLDAYGKDVVFPGQITSINPAETIVDGVPVYETKVAFTKSDERIRSGMTANATIVTNKKDGVLAIPADMIKSDKTGAYVNLLVSDDKTERRAVTTGLRSSDSFVEITSGLAEGDRVRADALN